MLVLSRKIGESIVIGDGIKITLVSIEQGKVKIGVEAPRDVAVNRQEIRDRIVKEQADAEGYS